MSKGKLIYLIQEATLIILGSYHLFFGATMNGLAGGSVPNSWFIPLSMWINVGLVGTISLIWLGVRLWQRKTIAWPPAWWGMVILFAAYTLSTVTSLDPRRSLNALWALAWALWVFWLVYDLAYHGWPIDIFVKVWLLLDVIVIGFLFWQLIAWEQTWLALSDGRNWLPPICPRIAPFYSHSNMLAAFLNLLWPPALTWAWRAHTRLGKLWCLLSVTVSWVALFFTSSRGGILGAAIALGVMLFLAIDWRQITNGGRMTHLLHRRWVTVAMVIALIAISGGGLLWVLQRLAHPTHGNDFWGARSLFWGVAWDAFRLSPLVGRGPDTYASDYIRLVSVPPNMIFVKAHSMVMQILDETGLVGLIAAGVCLVATGKELWRRRQVDAPQRHWFIGLAGGLITAIVHSLVDTPMAIPAIAHTMMIWLALLLALKKPTEKPTPLLSLSPRGAQLSAGLIALLLSIFVTGVGIWMQYGYTPYFKAVVSVTLGQWEAALPYLEEAVRRDPGHAYYHFQAGIAYARVSDDHPANRDAWLRKAEEHYRRGMQREPYYSVNHANLAMILWRQGKKTEAWQELQLAAALAPAEAAYPLNLGVYYEKAGATDWARVAYRQALAIRPQWSAAPFWQATTLRQEVHSTWLATSPAQLQATFAPQKMLEDADQTLRRDPADYTAYLQRALALEAQGQLNEALRAVKLAEFCAQGGGQAVPVSVRNDIAFHRARLTYLLGDTSSALKEMEGVIDAVRTQTLFGPNGEGAALYGWGIFYRFAWSEDILPDLEVIRLTDEQINRWLLLGEWYEAAHRPDEARRLYAEVLSADPHNSLALRRMAILAP